VSNRSTRIADLLAWEALDSRGRPTVACRISLDGGAQGEALAPSGASTGAHEAVELRDGGERYEGRGVLSAVANVRGAIREALLGMDAADQAVVDATMRAIDGTPQLSRLGANAVLAVSLACARAAAAARGEPLWRALAWGAPLLPTPMVNILSGGAHAAHMCDVQDFLAVPVGARSFAEAIEWVARVRAAAASLVAERGGNSHLVADEGGLAMHLADNADGLRLLTDAIERSGLRPRDDVAIALDVAATQLVAGGAYRLAAEGRTLAAAEMVDTVARWCSDWPVISVEDPLAEDDWDGWRLATERLGHLQLVGDDLFVTSTERLEHGIAAAVANTVLVKVNQNGTLSGSAEVMRRAAQAGYATVVSARSGETEDSVIADLAVAWRSGQIKVGSLTRSERTAKWNRLLAIEAELGDSAVFAGVEHLGGRRTAQPALRGRRSP
jgi:enolase